jgi:hypothetical protein
LHNQFQFLSKVDHVSLPFWSRVAHRFSKARLLMEKTLGFYGHTAKSWSIRDARKEMGCAIKTDGDKLLVATFGEWNLHRRRHVDKARRFGP